MTLTVLTLQPNSTVQLGTNTTVVPSGTANAALSDGSDTTYVQVAGLCRLDSQVLRVGFATPSLPSGAQVYSVGLRRRIQTVVAGADVPVCNHWFRSINGTVTVAGQTIAPQKAFYNSLCPTSPATATWVTENVVTATSGPGGQPWTVGGNLTGFTYDIGRGDASITSALRVSEVYLDITYQQLSTVTVTGPTGTVTSTRPTVTWTYASPDSQPQQAYEVVVYTAAQVASLGFVPFVTTPLQTSGVVIAEDLQWTLTSDITDGSYSAYVQATSQWAGVGSFTTAIASTTWTRAAAPASPPLTAVLSSAVFDAANNRVAVTMQPGAQPTVSATGSGWTSGGTGTTTLAVTPTAVGDVVVLATNLTSGTLTVTGVSGGGVTTWTRVEQPFVGSGSTIDMWMGTVTSTGSSTITITGSASLAAITVRLIAQQFTSSTGSSTQWALGAAGGGITNTSSTTVTFPTVTPTGTNQMYIGYAECANTGLTSGATSGYTAKLDNSNNIFLYGPDVSVVQSPTALQNTAGVSSAIGIFITAGAPTTAFTVQASRDGGLTWLLPDGSPSIPSLTYLPANGMTPLVEYDYVANINVASQYRVIAYSGNPLVAAINPSNVISVTPTGNQDWLKSPSNPLLNTVLPVAAPSDSTSGIKITKRRMQGTFQLLSGPGSEVLPFVVSGPTYGDEYELTFIFIVNDPTVPMTLFAAVDQLDNSGETLLWQQSNGTQLWVVTGPGASGTDTTEDYNSLAGDPTTIVYRRRKLVLTETTTPAFF